MASGDSNNGPPGTLGITLPNWMKKKTPDDRYAFDETPFSPPSPTDEYFLIKYPSVTRDPEKRSSYDTINSLIGMGRTVGKDAGSADAFGPAATACSTSGAGASVAVNGSDAENRKVLRRNSAITVLPDGQVSIKTYGDGPYKKSSDPGMYYGDYSNRHANPVSLSDQEMPLAPGELGAMAAMSLADDAAYESDCSVSSASQPPIPISFTANHPATGGITSTILGAIGHHLNDLTTGGHGIMDYFHHQDHEDHELTPPPTASAESTPPPTVSVNDRQRRLGPGAPYCPPHNPFFTEGSTMSLFSGLYSHDKPDASNSSILAKYDQADKSMLPSGAAGGNSSLSSSFATNRSSSAYDSQLIPSGNVSDIEMEALGQMDKERNRRWVPKPSRKRELNLFAPCSS